MKIAVVTDGTTYLTKELAELNVYVMPLSVILDKRRIVKI